MAEETSASESSGTTIPVPEEDYEENYKYYRKLARDGKINCPPSESDHEVNKQACLPCNCFYDNVKQDFDDINTNYLDYTITPEPNRHHPITGHYHLYIQFEKKRIDVTIRIKLDKLPSLGGKLEASDIKLLKNWKEYLNKNIEYASSYQKIVEWFDLVKTKVNEYWSTPNTKYKIVISNKNCEDVELDVFFHLVIRAPNYPNSNTSTPGATVDGKKHFDLIFDPESPRVETETAYVQGTLIAFNTEKMIFTTDTSDRETVMPHEYGHLMGLIDEYLYLPNKKYPQETERNINYYLNEVEKKVPEAGEGHVKVIGRFDGMMSYQYDKPLVFKRHYYPIAYRVKQEIYTQKGESCEGDINVYVK